MQVAFIIMLIIVAVLNLVIGFKLLPWVKLGHVASESSDRRFRKFYKIGGFALLLLAVINTLELAGVW